MGCLEYTLIALVIVIALSIALELFLSEYLLYHYDHDEPFDESEESVSYTHLTLPTILLV